MSESLYVRLGEQSGIEKITSDLVDNPLANTDVARLKRMAADFVITGTGGPQVYQGEDMRAIHANMNINDIEFMAVVDDAMNALDKNGIGQREKEEVLFILYSLRPEVVHL